MILAYCLACEVVQTLQILIRYGAIRVALYAHVLTRNVIPRFTAHVKYVVLLNCVGCLSLYTLYHSVYSSRIMGSVLLYSI